MRRPRALDLFCGAGGASMGLSRAGFDVTGVDLAEQPRYPFEFHRGDARAYLEPELLRCFDFVWASPPCQNSTAYRRRPNHVKPVDDLIPTVRAALRGAGVPHVIENVVGAAIESPTMLCGSMFGLGVRRHRLFETSFLVLTPRCRHDLQVGRYPQATNRRNERKTAEIGVWRIPLAEQRLAMGIDWMELEDY